MVKHYINLDYIQQPILPRLWMKQNDNESHQIVASLYDNGVAYTPDSGVIPVFRARKPDGTVAVYDGGQSGADVSLSGNVVTALVAEQVLTAPGCVACEINLYSHAGDKLTTFTFQVEVVRSVVDDGEIVSSDYYNILTQQIAQAIDAADDAAQSAQEAAQSAAQAANMIPKVSPTTAGNYPELTSNGTLTDSGIPARLPTPAEIGAVPTTRTVNGKALSSNITLDADDVDAVPINYNVISGHLTRFGSLGTLVDSNISADKVQELLSPSPWIYPTIQHATDPGPGFQVRYTKTGNIVSLAGSFETWDAGEAIFTLPEGYRPLGVWTFPGFDNSKNPDTVQQISINGDNGSLSVQSGGDSSTGYLYFSTSFAVRGGGIIDEP